MPETPEDNSESMPYNSYGDPQSSSDLDLTPWRIGNDPVVDRIATRRLLRPVPGNDMPGYMPDMRYEWGDERRNPDSGFPAADIVAHNADTWDRPVSLEPDWSNPTLPYLSTAAVYSDTQYPLVPNPQDRRRYEKVASRLIAARAEQTLARTAYGSLQEIGDGYDSDNSEKRHAADMSVDAADDVMKTAAAFLK